MIRMILQKIIKQWRHPRKIFSQKNLVQVNLCSSKTLLTYPSRHALLSDEKVEDALRKTMTDDRLSSFAILHIHKEKEINVESVLHQLAQHKERRQSLFTYKW